VSENVTAPARLNGSGSVGQDVDLAERILVATAIARPAAVAGAGNLPARAFANPLHRSVWASIKRGHVDLAEILSDLKGRGFGVPPANLSALVDGVPFANHLGPSASIVRAAAISRGVNLDVPEPSDEAPHTAYCSHVLDSRAACSLCGSAFGLDVSGLVDSTVAAARGRAIAETGVPWTVDGIIPAYGMLGMLVAYAKVGKTCLGHALGAAVSRGDDFIGRKTGVSRVLYVAAEDPPEYTDYLARHIMTAPERMTFYQRPLLLNDDGLARLVATIQAGGYGLVIIALRIPEHRDRRFRPIVIGHSEDPDR
jgi:hypothetical protein